MVERDGFASHGLKTAAQGCFYGYAVALFETFIQYINKTHQPMVDALC